MSNISDMPRRFITMMYHTSETLGHILKNTTEAQATTLHDGPEGWTILEVVCHLRDFDRIFRRRVEQMLAEDHPTLELVDHLQLVIDNAYSEQDIAYVYGEYHDSREKTIALFESVQGKDWERSGLHPTRGEFTVLDAALQVCTHDANHIEQITRILEQEVPGSGALPSYDHDGEDEI